MICVLNHFGTVLYRLHAPSKVLQAVFRFGCPRFCEFYHRSLRSKRVRNVEYSHQPQRVWCNVSPPDADTPPPRVALMNLPFIFPDRGAERWVLRMGVTSGCWTRRCRPLRTKDASTRAPPPSPSCLNLRRCGALQFVFALLLLHKKLLSCADACEQDVCC